MRYRALIIGAATMLALAVVLGLAASDDAERRPRRIAIFGDSLTFEATKYLQTLFDASPGFETQEHSLPGTAICDWFPQMEDVRDTFDPHVVAFQFVGNDILPCMVNPDGSQLPKPEYLRRWRRNTRHAIELFDPSVTIYLIGAPEMGDHDNRVYDIFADIARDYPNTRFVDGGRLVSPNRTFAATLPCRDDEPCTGPTVHGVRQNVVRTWDEVHFCPDRDSFGKPCPVYSSGAYRFAITMFEAVTGEKAPRLDRSAV
jgi:hypothetical protein